MSEINGDPNVELVERARRGDKEAFGTLCLEHLEAGKRFVQRKYGDTLGREAEDVVAASCAALWRWLPNLKDATKFRACFYRTLARTSLAWCRCKWFKVVKLEGDDGKIERLALQAPGLAEGMNGWEELGDPSHLSVGRELVEAAKGTVRRVYDGLSGIQKMVFEARLVKLYDEKKTENYTGLPLGTIRASYQRIARKLGKAFREGEFQGVTTEERRMALMVALGHWSLRGGGAGVVSRVAAAAKGEAGVTDGGATV